MSSRKQVAQLAGVSEATVSRVLNNVGPIKEETRQKVLQAAAKLNYYPSVIAQRMARRKSGNVGVVLPFMPKVRIFSTHYFSEIVSGIGVEVKNRGFDLLLLFREPEEKMDYSLLFHTQKIDACIILGATDDNSEIHRLQQLAKQRLPFCLVNQQFAGESFNVVDADHVEGSYSAVKHLLEQGCRRIAMLNGPQVYSNSRDRAAGYKQALMEADLPVEADLLYYGNYSRTSGYSTAKQMVQQMKHIDAVFAANDRMAIGLMQGLREQQIIAGKDYAIVGYDDSEAATLTMPSLTTVRVPFYDMGKLAAAKLLNQLLEGQSEAAFQLKLPTELIVRESSIKEEIK